jgi:hypothetical protein
MFTPENLVALLLENKYTPEKSNYFYHYDLVGKQANQACCFTLFPKTLALFFYSLLAIMSNGITLLKQDKII